MDLPDRGVVPAPPKAYDGEPDETDPDLLWAVGGMGRAGKERIRQWSRRPATASIKIEIAWVVHKKNDRAQGRAHDMWEWEEDELSRVGPTLVLVTT